MDSVIKNNKLPDGGTSCDAQAGNKESAVTNKQPSRPSSASRAELSAIHKEREEKIKLMKEKQNEERQRKLEELKAQALAAQKFREQKEEERRKRMEELRNRENDRRQQVEERKKAIWEAEKERREYILRKDQERQARMETKRKNERSQIAFAFGSSTPRMIETVDCSGMSMSSSFWATRRATSITNMSYGNNAALTRRSSERELGGDNKKRATSASGLDRQSEDDSGVDSQSYQRANRRKTDLMPTIPSPRDSSRTSFGTHTPRTPARAFSMTRLDQLATPVRRNGEHIRAIVERERKQAQEIENLSRLSLSRNSPTADSSAELKRKSRSMSQLAGAGRRTNRRDLSTGSAKGGPAMPQNRFKTSAHNANGGMRKTDTSKSMSQLSDSDNEMMKGRARIERSRKLRQQVKEQLSENKRPPLPRSAIIKRPTSASNTPTSKTGTEPKKIEKPRSTRATPGITPKGTTPIVSPSPDLANKTLEQTIKQASKTVTETLTKETGEIIVTKTEEITQEVTTACVGGNTEVDAMDEQKMVVVEAATAVVDTVVNAALSAPDVVEQNTLVTQEAEPTQERSNSDLDNVDMTASMIAKAKITTEEEAKAKLAEKRRLAREEAERQAELERQRQEEEARELLRQEQEAIRLAEEQRRQEEERLQQAIEEAKKREEEEQKKREEEARLKAERDLEEKRKAEEAEKLRLETAERLKKEEKEREERRKRVEAIMARTRKAGANNTPNKAGDDDDKSNSDNNMTQSQLLMSQSLTESMIQEIKEVTNSTNAETSNNASENVETTQVEESQEPQQQQQQQQETVSETSGVTDNGGSGDAQSQYEISVTEKENLLISSFNQNLNLNNGSSGDHLQEKQQHEEKSENNGEESHHNGKNGSELVDIGIKTTELIIQDAINQQNGHKNGGFEDVLKPIPVSESKLNSVNQDLITGQLIDFNNQTAATTTTTDVQMNIDDPLLSFNNNNNNNNLTPLCINIKKILKLYLGQPNK
uniref:CSON004601 protein n=1 Tax=Culicoides sonorensis TaxID=179676 RepID=A0A336LTN0_CULSO